MLRGRIKGAVWACFGVTSVLCLCAPASVWAQPGEGAPLVGWADGEAAFEWVQGWVRSEAGVPEELDLPDRAVAGLFGVYVTLRDEGRVLGRGQAIRSDVKRTIDAPGPPIQLASLLAAATQQALDELEDKQAERAVELNITDAGVLRQATYALLQRVQVDVQLGHSLESIILPLGARDDAVFRTFAPGYHGLRLAGALAGRADVAWPATELARNTTPPRLIFKLMTQQGYNADELPLVARAEGPALQRFEVIHVVRSGPAQPMRQLIRGNLIVQQQVIDGRTISGLAERVARNLDQLILTDTITGDEKVRGTYQPSLKRYAPEWANDREAALLGYALSRHAAVALDANLGGETMRARARRVLRIVNQIAPRALPDKGPPKHLTAAFLLLTLCETPERLTPDHLVLRDRLGQALAALTHPDGGGLRVAYGSDKRLSRATTAVATAALAAWYNDTRSKTLAQPVFRVLGDLMKANAQDPRVVDLLWVARSLDTAGDLLAENQPDPAEAKKTLANWRSQLADYIDLLSEQQVRGNPVNGPEDVVGGFILEPAAPGSPPEPDWQSAMPTTLLALGLRDPAIIEPGKHFGPVLTAGLGARYLGQLIVTAPSAYYVREIKPVLGGVRRTLWDNTLYPDCSAITLLAFTELQQTLRELEPED
ncbi:MAG: hypothetical protein ACPGYV_09010 [Phycisphaeraceae bacterium]